ncbi:hypothetical protein L1987_13932 [Smallanthus sonchifolius]|uniref:Uncharacterized protein n=1 Tax=Smallanthus sonchifolius TaxID=185202 RepID=A0ACB9JK31_9ASTR|nr:hypothetical protein L1987_13932 [Smallanthus sonchifolius]
MSIWKLAPQNPDKLFLLDTFAQKFARMRLTLANPPTTQTHTKDQFIFLSLDRLLLNSTSLTKSFEQETFLDLNYHTILVHRFRVVEDKSRKCQIIMQQHVQKGQQVIC